MEIFLIIYPKSNTKTGNLTLKGKRDVKKIFNILNSLIPPENMIIVAQAPKKHTEEIAKMFNLKFGEGEKNGDILDPKKFSEKNISYYEIKSIKSAILISDQPIPYLAKLVEKEPEIIKNIFSLSDGYALHLEVSSGSYATNIKTTIRNKIHLN